MGRDFESKMAAFQEEKTRLETQLASLRSERGGGGGVGDPGPSSSSQLREVTSLKEEKQALALELNDMKERMNAMDDREYEPITSPAAADARRAILSGGSDDEAEVGLSKEALEARRGIKHKERMMALGQDLAKAQRDVLKNTKKAKSLADHAAMLESEQQELINNFKEKKAAS